MLSPFPHFRPFVWIVAFLFATVVHAESFDVVLSGGQIIDGTGAPSYTLDIGIRNGRIVALGELADSDTEILVDCSGKTIVPGFIDLHSHADGPSPSGGLRSYSAKRRAAPNQVAQGVTTVVVNQDGRGPLDIDQQRHQIQDYAIGPNAVLMIGHNAVRRAVLRENYRRGATPGEMEEMAALVHRAMESGAFGMTAGLEYVPGIWSTSDELLRLVQEIVPYDGVYIAHERSSGEDPMWHLPSEGLAKQPTMLDSIQETISLGEMTGASVVATHIKARGRSYWGKSQEIVDAINEARERGVKIYADQYPYTSSGSDGLIVLIPYWVLKNPAGESGDYAAALHAALKNPISEKRLLLDIAHEIARRGGAENIVIFDHPDSTLIGKTLLEAAERSEQTPVEMALTLQFKGYQDRFGGARIRGFSMSENDVVTFMKQPWVATASDSGITIPEDGPVHPRHYGTFPRKIRVYALEKGVVSVPEAVRSMTSLPAHIMGITDRGRIAVGQYADIAVIDLDEYRDLATFKEPHRYPPGVEYVFVNGEMVVDHGTLTWALPGKVLMPRRNENSD